MLKRAEDDFPRVKAGTASVILLFGIEDQVGKAVRFDGETNVVKEEQQRESQK